MTNDLKSLNEADAARRQILLPGLLEDADWLSSDASGHAPFRSAEALVSALAETIRAASPAEQIALICVHPELAGPKAAAGAMGAASTAKLARRGFVALSEVVSVTRARVVERFDSATRGAGT